MFAFVSGINLSLRCAVRRCMLDACRSQGEEFEEPDVDDDEIQVVKDGDAAAAASKAAVEVIDMMDDDSSDEGPAPPPVRVKTEK